MRFIEKEGSHTIINMGICRLKFNFKYNTNKIYAQEGDTLRIVRKPPNGVKIRFRGENSSVIFSAGDFKKRFEKTCLDINSNCKLRIGKVNKYKIKKLFVFIENNSELEIDDNFNCAGCDFLIGVNSKIKIGKNCMFSKDITLRTTDFHPIYSLETKELINQQKNITIGSQVWIGEDVKILKGVTLADNIIAGCNSVVTKSILEPNVIIAGTPAVIVKRNVYWERDFVENAHSNNKYATI